MSSNPIKLPNNSRFIFKLFSYLGGFTAEELKKASEPIKNVLTLENGSETQIYSYRIARIIKKYQKNPTDTGSPVVQVVALSERIFYQANHVNKQRHDAKGYRFLQWLIHKRQKMLRYLKRVNYNDYARVVSDYNIPIDLRSDPGTDKTYHFLHYAGRSMKRVKKT